MEFRIGDCVQYGEKGICEEGIKGKIIAVANTTTDLTTTYLIILVSGQYVQFTSDNLEWCKSEEPVFSRQLLRTSPISLPVSLKERSCPSNYYEDHNNLFSLLVKAY